MSAIQAILISKPPIISNPNHHSKRFHFHPFNLVGFSSNRRKFQPLLFALHQDSNSSLSHGSEGQIGNISQETVQIGNGDDEKKKKRFNLYVFFMGLFLKVKNGFEKILFTWWPFWRQEKKLEMLFSEADLNPKDAAKQTALLVELNKHSPEAVIRRFEQRQYAVDSKGVAEYIRALVATNAIAEYLPDEQSGKPSGLPALLQELQQRASGNLDDSFLNPGISERQPLHVMMVDPKVSSRSSRFAQELISTILFTVAIGLMWVMGAAALQKYIGGLGGIGASGVGSSSSYTPKESNKEISPEKNVKTFKDVKGCDDAKQELEEVVEYLKNPGKFTRLGGKLPKGILLTGAPGTGKTLLAKAIAGEAGVPFFYRAGSEFEEMFVGVGARRVRSLFQAAKKKAPCIIFIDEIDAVGSTRKQWEGHTKKTLHQLLVEMDGFEQNEGIILMAATNLPDILDPALTRPGRFDRHIVVQNPDVKGRQEILDLYLQDKPLADDVDVKAIARGTPGFNGADLANLVNVAAIKAAVEGAEKLNASQLEFAKDRIIMGTERKTMYLSEDSKKLTAYHESGHAIVALNTDGAHPIHKATIMPRGSALGMVTQLPSNDETSVSRKQLLARLDVCMGGRVAEELIFGSDHVTTCASSDLQSATELAQYMFEVVKRTFEFSSGVTLQDVTPSPSSQSYLPVVTGVLSAPLEADSEVVAADHFPDASPLIDGQDLPDVSDLSHLQEMAPDASIESYMHPETPNLPLDIGSFSPEVDVEWDSNLLTEMEKYLTAYDPSWEFPEQSPEVDTTDEMDSGQADDHVMTGNENTSSETESSRSQVQQLTKQMGLLSSNNRKT